MPQNKRHEHAKKLADDGGMVSRKLLLTLLVMFAITGLGLLCGLSSFTALAPNLEVIVGGLLGALAIFCGANVSTKFASAGVAKALAAAEKPQPPVEEAPEE